MGLWDALSGKIYRWNEMKTEANRQFCQHLSAWHRIFARENKDLPTIEEGATHLRNILHAYFFAAHIGISNHLDDELEFYKAALMGLNCGSYLALISSCHAASLTLRFPHEPVGLNEFLHAVAGVYRRSTSFAESWRHCLDWLAPESPKDFPGAVAGKLADEARAILGVDGPLFVVWPTFAIRSARVADELMADPKWPRTAEAEIAAAVKI